MANFTVSLLLKLVDEATAPLRRVMGAFDGLGGAAKAATGGFAMFGLAADGVRQASSLITAPLRLINDAIVEPTAKYETFLTQLETTEKSAEKAKTAFDWIKKFAADTPYDIDGVTEAFVGLRAQGLEATDGTLRILGDAAAAFGKTLADGAEALTDALTGENERLKAFGITTSVNSRAKEVTYSWMEAGQQVSRTVDSTDRKLMASVLLGALDRNFSGSMDRLSRTWKGMLSTIADTLTNIGATIGQSGLLDYLKEQLGGMLAALDEMAKSGELQQLTKDLGQDLAGAARTLGSILPEAGRALHAIGDAINWVGTEIDLAEAFWNSLTTAVRGFVWEIKNAYNGYLEFRNTVRGAIGLPTQPIEALPPKPGSLTGGRGADDVAGGSGGDWLGGFGAGGSVAGRVGSDRLGGADSAGGERLGAAVPSIFNPILRAASAPAATGRVVVEFRNPQSAGELAGPADRCGRARPLR